MAKRTSALRWLVVAAILGAFAPPGEAALPPPPFELQVVPSAVEEGGRLIIEVKASRQKMGTGPAGQPFDIYLSVLLDGKWTWVYLVRSTNRDRSVKPAPFLKDATLSTFTGLAMQIEGAGPAGWYIVRAEFMKSPSDFPSRKNYLFQPLTTTIRIRPTADGGSRGTLVLGTLGLVTLGASLLVTLLPRPKAD